MLFASGLNVVLWFGKWIKNQSIWSKLTQTSDRNSNAWIRPFKIGLRHTNFELDVAQMTNSHSGYKIYNLLLESKPLSSPYRGDALTIELSGHDMPDRYKKNR
jgi:hypothetical protein